MREAAKQIKFDWRSRLKPGRKRPEPMDWDTSTRNAINIGVANKRVIELVQNWCAHVTCEKYGGTGLIEVETGLPIGMRRFRCPHASAAGMAGMQLDMVALDFYDRNCSSCRKRQAVRLPNLSELVAERDRVRQERAEAAARDNEEQNLAFRKRSARREALSRGCDPATAGIFEIIDQLDREPSDHHSRMLVETASATPARFEGPVVEALFDLAATTDGSKIEPALTALATTGADCARLCRTALAVLSRGIRSVISGHIVAKHLDAAHRDLVPAALTSVIGLALPVHGFDPNDGLPGNPEAVRTVYRFFPDLTLDAVKTLLRDSAKAHRIAAANAIVQILDIDPAFGLKVIDALIASLDLADDIYGFNGSAQGWACKTLARIMCDHPRECDARVQQAIGISDEDKTEALFDVYDRVFRLTEKEDEEAAAATTAHEIAYERMIEVVVRRITDKRLTRAIWFLRRTAKRYPDLLERHADKLLGASALIASELDAPSSPLLNLEVPPNPLRELETQSKRQSLFQALNAAMEAVAAAALRKPRTVAVSVVRTYDTLDDRHEHFKAALVRCLGAIAADPGGLTLALPPLYDAMTSRSVAVRGAAASAYAQVAKESPEDLPSLFHEAFILLLADPYVFVHRRAVEALREVSLPDAYAPRVRRVLLGLVSAHAMSRKHEDVLAQCIAAILSLPREGEAPPAGERDMLFALINRLTVHAAAEFVERESYLLRGATGVAALFIKVLADSETDEYMAGQCLWELRRLPLAEIAAEAAALRDAAAASALRDIDITDDVLEILTAAGAWPAAADVACDATQRLSDTRWDRPLKLRSRSRQLAVEIERAAASADSATMDNLARQWLALEKDVAQDDREPETQR